MRATMYNVTDGRTDRQTDDMVMPIADISYCEAVRSARKAGAATVVMRLRALDDWHRVLTSDRADSSSLVPDDVV